MWLPESFLPFLPDYLFYNLCSAFPSEQRRVNAEVIALCRSPFLRSIEIVVCSTLCLLALYIPLGIFHTASAALSNHMSTSLIVSRDKDRKQSWFRTQDIVSTSPNEYAVLCLCRLEYCFALYLKQLLLRHTVAVEI